MVWSLTLLLLGSVDSCVGGGGGGEEGAGDCGDNDWTKGVGGRMSIRGMFVFLGFLVFEFVDDFLETVTNRQTM